MTKRYDSGARRLSARRGRETGCHIFIPGEELAKAGFAADQPPPFYRTWGSKSGGVFVRLYRERGANE